MSASHAVHRLAHTPAAHDGPRLRVRTHYYFTNQKSPVYFCGKSKLANPVRPGDPRYVDLPEVVCPACEVVYLNLMMGQ